MQREIKAAIVGLPLIPTTAAETKIAIPMPKPSNWPSGKWRWPAKWPTACVRLPIQ